MSKAERRITAADILPAADYVMRRNELRTASIARKKNRRIEVGPFSTFYFENYESMWLQVQEMLRIEKGGADQIEGELATYNPLIPQGHELIATLMLEIEDPRRRETMLYKLAGVEETVSFDLDGETIKATPTEYDDRTTPDGKTSSVHWVRFVFTPSQIAKFKSGEGRAAIAINHPAYGHIAIIPPNVREELATDFV
ncbi:MAG TPA: DUF3501 family protein [Rhizomicrobium sp.]|jgi:hypothetical protein|nr:DUF3501 family protein [Rhizomicrobium sp.]